MQHPALRMGDVEAALRARHRDIHEPPLLLDAVVFVAAVLVRKQPFFEAGDEYGVELEPLGRVHGHELQRRPALGRLRFARLERRMREECRQRIGGAGRDGRRGVRGVRREHRRVHRQIGFAQKALRGVDELVEIVDPVSAVLFVAVMRGEAGCGIDVRDRLGQRQADGRGAHAPR